MVSSAPPDRVLVADPDPEQRKRLAAVVTAAATASERAVEIVEAADGTTALNLWSEQAPRLVVCEVLLDGMSGLSLLRRMKTEDAPLPPVIFVTRLARESDRYWGLRNGAHAYVPKPYDDAQLQARVEVLLEQGSGASRQRPID